MATASGTFVASVIMPDREGRFSISLRDGQIAEIEPERHDSSTRAWLALPGFVNLHAHVDRTFTVTSFRPRSFADALAASAKARAVRYRSPGRWAMALRHTASSAGGTDELTRLGGGKTPSRSLCSPTCGG